MARDFRIGEEVVLAVENPIARVHDVRYIFSDPNAAEMVDDKAEPAKAKVRFKGLTNGEHEIKIAVDGEMVPGTRKRLEYRSESWVVLEGPQGHQGPRNLQPLKVWIERELDPTVEAEHNVGP